MSAAATPGEFSRTTFKTLILRLITQALTVGAGIIIARSLGPAGKGIFTYASTVLVLLVTLGGGASAAVSRQYGRLQVPRGVVYAGMMRFFYVVCLPVSLLLAAVAIFVHQPALIAPAVAFPFA
ncbi:MAG TPA: hypothetical protein VFE17_09680, partial [Candidatus Baltobacteraceae bacterium]|nr:hypothetical protein [Candidatus Baltobacteraceae bacterium]